MRLTSENLRVMYEFLTQLAPIKGWKLPPSQEVLFFVCRDATCYGEFEPTPNTIRLSSKKISHLDTAMKTMAHEMVHLKLFLDNNPNWDKHKEDFRALADTVSIPFGWDPLEF